MVQRVNHRLAAPDSHTIILSEPQLLDWRPHMPRIFQLTAAAAAVFTLSLIACSGGLDPSSSTPAQRPDRISPDPHSKVPGGPTLDPQQSGTTNRLQAVSPVNQRVVWAS